MYRLVENMNNEHTSKAKGNGGDVEEERCDFCSERRTREKKEAHECAP